MNDSKNIPAKLFISIVIPLIIVTFGGLIVYQTPAAFFFQVTGQSTAEGSGPAVIYYALTLVVALMFFLMRQQYKWYEIIALGVMSMVYSLSLKQMTPGVFRPIYVYIIPLLIFFLIVWAIMKYIFLNQKFRSFRLLLFAMLCSGAFTLAFWVQYTLIKLQMDSTFLQAKFFNGLMLFIFMGFGFTLAEFIIVKLESTKKEIVPAGFPIKKKDDLDEDDEAN